MNAKGRGENAGHGECAALKCTLFHLSTLRRGTFFFHHDLSRISGKAQSPQVDVLDDVTKGEHQQVDVNWICPQ